MLIKGYTPVPIIFFVLCFLTWQICSAQTKAQTDSLTILLPKLKGKSRLECLIALSELHIKTDKDWQKVDLYAREALEIAKAQKNEVAEAQACYALAYIPTGKGQIENAVNYLQNARRIFRKHDRKNLLAEASRLTGYYYFFLPKLDSMKFFYQEAFMLFAETKDWFKFEWLIGSTKVYYEGYTKKQGLLRHFKEIESEMLGKNSLEGAAIAQITLGRLYLNYGDKDSAFFYTRRAYQTLENNPKSPVYAYALSREASNFIVLQNYDSAKVKLDEMYKIVLSNKDTFGINKVKSLYCTHAAQTGQLDSAELYYDNLVKLFENRNDKDNLIAELQYLANQSFLNNNFTLSLKFYVKLYKILEAWGYKDELAQTQEALAKLYLALQDNEKALVLAQNAMKNYVPKMTTFELISRNGIYGFLLLQNEKVSDAVKYLSIADSLSIANNSQTNQAIVKYWLGLAFLKQGLEEKALEYFLQSVKIKNDLNRKTFSFHGPLAVYSALAKYWFDKNDMLKAMKYAHLSLKETLSDVYITKSVVMQDYLTLYKIHKKKNNIDSALYYHEKYLAEKDEYEKENQFRKVIALEVETATEKQERENHILKQQNQLNQLELNERERLQTISLVGIFLLLVVLFYIAYVNREKHRANTLLKAQKEEIAAQAANLEAANSAITLQKNEIEKSHRHITASINYARRIQTAALPDDNEIKDILCDYFVFFKPCDIVSGDFYLLKKINEKIFVVAADCTGHGVPGAFMSMLGMAFLNDILAQNHEKSAAKILNDLRFGIKKALRQDGKIGEQQDGMDMALLIFDTKKREVNFAGANNPLIFFRKGEMHELKADNMPIGIFKKENDFQDHHFAAEINDRFYLFSDGYLSQFGGENNTPLKSKQFKALLNELSVMPFNEQKERVQAFLVAWQGEQKQTDDILVIGLSFDCYFDN